MEIIGDVIYFEGQIVGMVTVKSGTLRDRLVDWIDASHANGSAEDKIEQAIKHLEDAMEILK